MVEFDVNILLFDEYGPVKLFPPEKLNLSVSGSVPNPEPSNPSPELGQLKFRLEPTLPLCRVPPNVLNEEVLPPVFTLRFAVF